MINDKIDKTIFSIHDLHEPDNSRAEWMKKTSGERFAAIELLRRMNYGKDYDSKGLERVFEIVELSQG